MRKSVIIFLALVLSLLSLIASAQNNLGLVAMNSGNKANSKDKSANTLRQLLPHKIFTPQATAPIPVMGKAVMDEEGVVSMSAGTFIIISDEVVSGLWSSSDPRIAIVDDSGKVTGIIAGKVWITHVINGEDGDGTSVTPIVVSAPAAAPLAADHK